MDIKVNLKWMGAGLAAGYWLLEAGMHVFVFQTGCSFGEALLAERDPNEISMRLTIAGLLMGFGFLAENSVVGQRALRRQAERQIRLLKFLSECNQLIQRQAEERDLLAAVCRFAVEKGGFRFAWAGLKRGDTLELAAWAAADPAVAERVEKLRKQGALLRCLGVREVLDRGESLQCELAQREGCPAPWLETFLEQGCCQAMAMPLRVGDRVAGVYEVYAGGENKISLDEMAILNEVADDVSVCLTRNMEAEAREKTEETMRERVEELERFERATIGREFRIKELRDEIKTLKAEIARLRGEKGN